VKFTKVQTPRGAKDILPPDGYKKSYLEGEAAAFLEAWGYRRVYTPTFEYYDALVQGNGPQIDEKLYRFVDRDGHTLALRPEMTTPIARMAATRYTPAEMPVRLYYVGSVFRYDEVQAGRQREFTQVGVELLGAAGPAADAELVALAVSLLGRLGLRAFHVDLGHIGYIHSLLEALGDDGLAAELKGALLARDYVRYEALLKGAAMETELKEALLALPEMRGGAEVVAAAREAAGRYPKAVAALAELEAIYRLASAYGVGEHLAIDLAVVKDFDYYTGLLLEGYTPELGLTLCTGGRYDSLVGRFGSPCPATGFALGVERAMLALERQGWRLHEPAPDLFLYTETDQEVEALFGAAALLRARGVRVELALDPMSADQAQAAASRRGIERTGRVYRAEGGRVALAVTPEGGPAPSGPLEPAQAGEGAAGRAAGGVIG